MKRIVIALALLIATPDTFGQESSSKHAIEISWSISTPIGNDNFMNKANWISPTIGYEYHVLDKLSIGASIGYSYGKENAITRDHFDGDLLDGNTIRSLTMIPALVQVRYSPLAHRPLSVQPYLNAGMGINYAKFNIKGDLISSIGKSNWGALAEMRTGVRYALGTGRTSVDGSLFWQYAENKFAPMNIERQQSIGVQFGIVFGL